MSKLVSCPKCNGSKKLRNPDYEEELDRQIDKAPSGDIAAQWARRKYDEYIKCDECGGTGQVTQ